jgi:hypothetical protein
VSNDTAPVFPNLCIDELFKMHLEALVRAFLVRAHKARIAHRISGEDRGQTADQRHRSGAHLLQRFIQDPLYSAYSRYVAAGIGTYERLCLVVPTQRADLVYLGGLQVSQIRFNQ